MAAKKRRQRKQPRRLQKRQKNLLAKPVSEKGYLPESCPDAVVSGQVKATRQASL